MNAETISQILNELGKRLSEPASYTWSILVKQSITEGVINLILCLILIFITNYCQKANDFNRWMSGNI